MLEKELSGGCGASVDTVNDISGEYASTVCHEGMHICRNCVAGISVRVGDVVCEAVLQDNELTIRLLAVGSPAAVGP